MADAFEAPDDGAGQPDIELHLARTDRFSAPDNARITHALEYATTQHRTQRRLSGEPYILHPFAVAQLCIDRFDADADTVIAALLHDTVEDTTTTFEDIESAWGRDVRDLVDSSTNVGEGDGHPKIIDWYVRTNKSHAKLRTFGARDPRAFIIKIADRWHNVLSGQAMKPYNRKRLMDDVLSFTVPLCRELGFNEQADEIEAAVGDVLEGLRREQH